jgi:hypothetical protein
MHHLLVVYTFHNEEKFTNIRMRETWFVKLLDTLAGITSSTVLNTYPLTMGGFEAYTLIQRHNSAADKKISCITEYNEPTNAHLYIIKH